MDSSGNLIWNKGKVFYFNCIKMCVTLGVKYFRCVLCVTDWGEVPLLTMHSDSESRWKQRQALPVYLLSAFRIILWALSGFSTCSEIACRPFAFSALRSLFRSRKALPGFLCSDLRYSGCFYFRGSIIGTSYSLPISSGSCLSFSQAAAAPQAPHPGSSPEDPLIFSFNSFTAKHLEELGSD